MILKEELIGLEAKVVSSTNSNIIGLRGKIIDETRNTLSIETERGSRIAIKEQCGFFIKSGNDWLFVAGRLLVNRPEERIKK